MLPSGLSITWFGHSTFLVQLPSGKRLLFDPFFVHNPSCPPDKKDVSKLGPVDMILVTHGHDDHFADAGAAALAFGCPVVGIFETVVHLSEVGVTNLHGMNVGGSAPFPELGITITATQAIHSNSVDKDGQRVYAGVPLGFVVTDESGFAFYFAGDTALFSDMALISELYKPTLAFLPIGDYFTMGPREAARAVQFLSSVTDVIPMHYNTFPELVETAEPFQAELTKRGSSVTLLVPAPGETLTF